MECPIQVPNILQKGVISSGKRGGENGGTNNFNYSNGLNCLEIALLSKCHTREILTPLSFWERLKNSCQTN
jgi:hypothetical protein